MMTIHADFLLQVLKQAAEHVKLLETAIESEKTETREQATVAILRLEHDSGYSSRAFLDQVNKLADMLMRHKSADVITLHVMPNPSYDELRVPASYFGHEPKSVPPKR